MKIKAETVQSVTEMANSGQNPAAYRVTVAIEMTITAVVSGNASIFVIRK